MGSMVVVLLWVWIILHSRVCSFSLPEITDRNFIDECVEQHNRARSSVSPPATDMLHMTWDQGLAITARAWAKHCAFEHNIHLKDVRRMHPTFSSVGENIWTAYPPSEFTPANALKSWVDEVNFYNYERNNCTKICGHYTQVVWASSYKVGCAVQLCPNGVRLFTQDEGVLFVCNYATAGNINGMQPYSKGPACSGCSGTCVKQLCSYNWTPDWDVSVSSSSSSNYISILIVRPIALSFTFLTAFVVHYFYPDVFCYE
uniref:SCP domain-containing protein n=1 Tax=Amphilophus citrinellus TaxID=61819 RepID=A0A3Q0T0R6_AMPCI